MPSLSRSFVRFNTLLGVILLSLAAPAPAIAQGLEDVKAHYTKYEYRIPMRDGKRLFTAVYVPKDDEPDLSDPADAHAVQRQALRRRSVPRQTSARRRCSARRATSSSTRTCAAAGCPKASSSTCGRTTPPRRARGHRRKQRHLRHHRLAGQARAQQQRQGRPVGHLVSRLLHRRRHDRRPSGAEGRLAAGPGHRLVHRRRLAPQRRPVPAARVQLHGAASAGRGPSRPRSSTPTLRSRHARRLRLLPEAGPARQRRRTYFKGEVGLLERGDEARHLRRVLEGPQPPPAPQEHQAGRDDRRRLVRRREPLRRPGDLQERRDRTRRRPATCW